MNIKEYCEKLGLYKEFAAVVADILKAAMKADNNSLRLWEVQNRAKRPPSILKKLTSRNDFDRNNIEGEIKDLAGCRLIFYSNDDIVKFRQSGIVDGNFEVDWKESKIHHSGPNETDANELYRADHYVVELTEERLSLPEFNKFKGLRCEIQIQTILNHAWSETGHDIIYKPPKLHGIGKKQLDEIRKRMAKIMSSHLIPAGHDFQKVLYDFDRLKNGKELFDRDVLKAILDAKDNNDRYDILDRYEQYVLPNYDDLPGVFEEIRSTLVKAISVAREVEPDSIKVPGGEFPGRTIDDITKSVMSCFGFIRYVEPEVVFSTLIELHESAETDEEKHTILGAVGELAEHNVFVWKEVGPEIQSLLITYLNKLSDAELLKQFPIIVEVCSKALSPEVTGTSWTSDTATFHRGAVIASEQLRQMRTTAIDVLKRLYHQTGTDGEKRQIINGFNEAMRSPYSSNYSDDLLSIVLANTVDVYDLYIDKIPAESFELRQSIEHAALWTHRRTKELAGSSELSKEINLSASRLIDRIVQFRNALNQDQEYVRYKVLVGFESVFPEAWEDNDYGYEEGDKYRDQEMDKYIDQITDNNFHEWYKFIVRCAQTRSDDLATFPKFTDFLTKLSRRKPDLMISILNNLNE